MYRPRRFPAAPAPAAATQHSGTLGLARELPARRGPNACASTHQQPSVTAAKARVRVQLCSSFTSRWLAGTALPHRLRRPQLEPAWHTVGALS